MSRRDIISQKRDLAALLSKVASDPCFSLTNYMKQKLVDEGYLGVSQESNLGPGRPREKIFVTPKGKNIVNLSKSWNMA